MKNKKILTLLAALTGFALSITACGGGGFKPSSSTNGTSISSKNNQNTDEQIRAIYQLYVASTDNPKSYEEWLASIKGEQGEPGHSPVIAINGEGYWTIDGVSTGVKATGNAGSPGQKGSDGTSLLTGQGQPTSALGIAGDSYIDTSSWDYYVKNQSGWSKVGNINHGSLNEFRTGSGAPDSLLGNVGDSYVNTANWDFYVKTASGWELVTNLKAGASTGQTAWSNTILPSDYGYVTVNVGSAVVGTTIVFTAYPDQGCKLTDLELNGQSVINNVVNNTYTTKMVENGFVVKAVFTETSHKHTWGLWETSVEPTETTDGIEIRTCRTCGETQQRVVPATGHTYDGWTSNDSSHFHVCTGCGEIIDITPHSFVEINRVEPTSYVDGYYTEKCSVCGYERQTVLYSDEQTIRIVATNDIHGQIYEEGNGYVERVGIDKYMTYLKNKKDGGKTLLLDQGDTWQGSIYSNFNHGALLTDLMNYVKFDSRTVGNHDFDWGVDPVIINGHKDYQGYTTPTLAANVYDYNFDTKVEGSTQQEQIGVPSVTYTVAGVKVGIIGTIGSDQITSICTNNVKNICFKQHIPIIKQEANRLRNVENCDLVILSHHGDQDDLRGNNLNQFLDAALCAHTHQLERSYEGDMIYIQGASNNKYICEMDITYNCLTKQFVNNDNYYIAASDIDRDIADNKVDPTIADLVAANYQLCAEQQPLNDVVANNVQGTFYQSSNAANLMAEAVYEAAVDAGFNIYCSYVNTARHNLDGSSWSFAQVFEAFPFDNEVYILDVSAQDMVHEIGNYNNNRKNMSLWPEYFDISDTSNKYRIAVIDYLGVHSNANREYDYFPSCQGRVTAKLSKTYRDILIDYLKKHNYNKGEVLDAYSFDSSNPLYNRYGVTPTKPCRLTFMYNYSGAGIYAVETAIQGESYSNYYPSNPSRNDYTFTGWFFDSDCTQSVSGKVMTDKTLYAGWSSGASATNYTASFTLGYLYNGTSYDTGNNTYTMTASSSSGGTIDVTVNIESAKYNADYGEFGLGGNTGLLFTLPSGYVITDYEAKVYNTFDNLALYSDNSRETQYDVGNKVVGSSNITYSNSGLSYSSLYFYNTYSGNFWFYYINLTIARAQFLIARNLLIIRWSTYMALHLFCYKRQ